VSQRQSAGMAREVAEGLPADEAVFTRLTERHRRELHVHCYRMLASFDDAEDAVQEALLRAWRARESFDGSMLFLAWLYRIATRVCLDVIRRRTTRARATASFADLPWLQPYPDRLLDEMAPRAAEPEAVAVDRETIGLAFVAAAQLLPARQRAAFLVRDVLGWSAQETAGLLETSVAAANSALQRARATMRDHLGEPRSEWSTPTLTLEDKQVLARFIEAHEQGDAAAILSISARHIRVTMPPYPYRFDGIEAMKSLLDRAFGRDREGDWRLLPTAANRLPAAASYLRRPDDVRFRAFKVDVLQLRDRRIAQITTFGPALLAHFGLPHVL
jgi:RNA polymerase sigma-70 factor (TIGR02960 family)